RRRAAWLSTRCSRRGARSAPRTSRPAWTDTGRGSTSPRCTATSRPSSVSAWCDTSTSGTVRDATCLPGPASASTWRATGAASSSSPTPTSSTGSAPRSASGSATRSVSATSRSSGCARAASRGNEPMSFEFLFQPVESVDAWLEALFAGAPFVFVLVIALLLGLRHASDPDHLVAVTSLVAVDQGDVRGAARLGAWWGMGHAAALVGIGVPLILFKSELPAWLERGAETAVGVVILLLALRIVVKWARGDFRGGGREA